MAETKQEPRLHVVVFPWLAFGHIVPFLELAEQLARRGHFVTFISAPRNIARLRPAPGRELSPRIRLVGLPLPAVDGLPDGAESTNDVPPEKVELLKVAFDGLAGPVASFLAEACAGSAGGEGHGRRPDWIILDAGEEGHGRRATAGGPRGRHALARRPAREVRALRRVRELGAADT